MAADSREALIRSGIELTVAQGWQDLQASVGTRAITERAGVTTGSFFHHFRNRAHFAEVLAERFSADAVVARDRLLADVERLIGDGDPRGIRPAAMSDWSTAQAEEAHAALLHLLWAARRQPVSEDADLTAGDVLRERYQGLSDVLMPVYQRAQNAMGREMLPPFTMVDLTTALTALSEGLQMRHEVDPDAVRDGLYVDVVTALVVALTRPLSERAERVDLAALEVQLAPPTGATIRSEEGQTWRQIADASAHLFVDRLVGDVKVAEIAQVAGVSPSTVYHQFGTVSAVAAATWARHFPELEAISTRPLTASEGPIVRLEQVLGRFVDLAKQNRGATEGLVLEVLAESGPVPPRNRPRKIRTSIPLPSLLIPHVRELRTRGLLRRRIDSESLARSMLQLVTMRVLMSTSEPAERIIDDTLGILLEGALAHTGPS